MLTNLSKVKEQRNLNFNQVENSANKADEECNELGS